MTSADESRASLSVDENALMRRWGRSSINPTVSERRTVSPFFSLSLLVVVSSVAKSLSSTRTSAFVRAFIIELFPAFV